jgi:hypothetical protein
MTGMDATAKAEVKAVFNKVLNVWNGHVPDHYQDKAVVAPFIDAIKEAELTAQKHKAALLQWSKDEGYGWEDFLKLPPNTWAESCSSAFAALEKQWEDDEDGVAWLEQVVEGDLLTTDDLTLGGLLFDFFEEFVKVT